jgi:hypothetical protein
VTLWTDITPEVAAKMTMEALEAVEGNPVNEMGERCPWPWEPQQLVGVPLGQYHCPFCGAMVIAGIPHVDYRRLPG